MNEDQAPPDGASDLETTRQDPWPGQKPVVGMVHLLPLPGSPGYGGSMDDVLGRASRDANLLAEAGLDGILVENFGDAPFFPRRVPAETVAAMALAVREVMATAEVPVGVNVLRNDADAAISVAAAAGARFVRVNVHTGSMFTDQGLLEGQAHSTLRKRETLGGFLAILADVMVKHATPPPGLTLESAARDCWFRGLADGLVLTGTETGAPVDPELILRTRESLPQGARIWVGSGACADTVDSLLEAADGVIVGTALQSGGLAGAGIDPHRVKLFMSALGRA